MSWREHRPARGARWLCLGREPIRGRTSGRARGSLVNGRCGSNLLGPNGQRASFGKMGLARGSGLRTGPASWAPSSCGCDWVSSTAVETQVELHRTQRFLALGAVVSEGIVTEQTTIPGHGWATTMLKLALVLPLGKVHSLHRTVMPMVVVDDMSLPRVGGRDRARRELIQATKDLQSILAEYDLHVHSD
eukprot:3282659-Pyramimonas_sp.AAC.1